jgi:hypothetical protein
MPPAKVQIHPWSQPPFGMLARMRRLIACSCGQALYAGCSALICPTCSMFIGPYEPPLDPEITCNRNGERR